MYRQLDTMSQMSRLALAERKHCNRPVGVSVSSFKSLGIKSNCKAHHSYLYIRSLHNQS